MPSPAVPDASGVQQQDRDIAVFGMPRAAIIAQFGDDPLAYAHRECDQVSSGMIGAETAKLKLNRAKFALMAHHDRHDATGESSLSPALMSLMGRLSDAQEMLHSRGRLDSSVTRIVQDAATAMRESRFHLLPVDPRVPESDVLRYIAAVAAFKP
jgi:hypothetical protein